MTSVQLYTSECTNITEALVQAPAAPESAQLKDSTIKFLPQRSHFLWKLKIVSDFVIWQEELKREMKAKRSKEDKLEATRIREKKEFQEEERKKRQKLLAGFEEERKQQQQSK